MSIQIKRLTPTIGAEISGIDLRNPISAEDAAALRAAWQKHLVLVLPKQDIAPEQHIAFARVMGHVDSDSAISVFGHPKYPEIFLLTNEMKDGKPSDTRDVGWQWHVDLTYTLRPSAGAVLHALEIPETGGDTMFANMEAAFSALSPTYQQMLRGLEAVHDISHGQWWKKRNPAVVQDNSKTVRDFDARTPPVVQPMVRKHPDTGRESILVGQAVVDHIHGMTREESDPIIDYLTELATRPEFVYRHRWTRGDLLVWDNRCTMHKVVHDHNEAVAPGTKGQVRRMHRVTLQGAPSGRLLHAVDKAA